MKYYFIVGEASGDLHASNLLKALKAQDPEAEFRAWGGDLMAAQGADIRKHYRELAFMGFTEVLMNLRTILGNLKNCENDILQWKPDVVIMVDYPGFNLRLAEALHKKGIRIFYYISPQVWAWKQSRVKKIKQFVDKMFVILPFEKDFYQRFDYHVEFVGHPLLDAIENLPAIDESAFKKEHHLNEKPVIGIIPGSRKQEVRKMLLVMLEASKNFPDYQFVIAGAPSLTKEFYDEVMCESSVKNIQVIHNRTYDIMRLSKAGMVTSGTATLEAALLDLPEVVCYRGGKISYLIARSLIKVKFISLVNLIMDKEIVKELIQDDFNTKQLTAELKKILPGTDDYQRIKSEYADLRIKLGGKGASEITAASMLKTLRQQA